MTVVYPCDVCGRPFRSIDLHWVRVVPPHYIDLPEGAEHVDAEGTFDEPEVSLHYCGECVGKVELPPLESKPDEDPASPHRIGEPTTRDCPSCGVHAYQRTEDGFECRECGQTGLPPTGSDDGAD